MNLSTDTIKQIAEELECNLEVYINKTTKEVHSFVPNFEDFIDEETDKEFNNIQNNPDDYFTLEPMHSSEAFAVMENFASQLNDETLKIQLTTILKLKSPFANFNQIIHNSDKREDWFAFKSNAYCQYVEENIANFD